MPSKKSGKAVKKPAKASGNKRKGARPAKKAAPKMTRAKVAVKAVKRVAKAAVKRIKVAIRPLGHSTGHDTARASYITGYTFLTMRAWAGRRTVCEYDQPTGDREADAVTWPA